MSVNTMASWPGASGKTRPIATPAIGCFSGTPASCSAKQPAQTVAMELLPLLSVMVLSKRMEYGNCDHK